VASFGGCDFFVPRNRRFMREIGTPPAGRQPFSLWRRARDANPFTARKDIVDNQVVIMEFANGFRATFHTNCSTAIGERRMYICGSKGTLRFHGMHIELKRIGYAEEKQEFHFTAGHGHGGADTVLARELAQAILHNTPMPTTLDDGLNAVVTCLGIDRAMRTGRVIDMTPLWKRIA
jgi:predicted dehydrogenase